MQESPGGATAAAPVVTVPEPNASFFLANTRSTTVAQLPHLGAKDQVLTLADLHRHLAEGETDPQRMPDGLPKHPLEGGTADDSVRVSASNPLLQVHHAITHDSDWRSVSVHLLKMLLLLLLLLAVAMVGHVTRVSLPRRRAGRSHVVCGVTF